MYTLKQTRLQVLNRKKQPNYGWNSKPADSNSGSSWGANSNSKNYKPNPSWGSNTNTDDPKSWRPYFNNNCEQGQHFNKFQKNNSKYDLICPEHDRPRPRGHYGPPRVGRDGRGNHRWFNPNHCGNGRNREQDKEHERNLDRDRDCFGDNNSPDNKKQRANFPSEQKKTDPTVYPVKLASASFDPVKNVPSDHKDPESLKTTVMFKESTSNNSSNSKEYSIKETPTLDETTSPLENNTSSHTDHKKTREFKLCERNLSFVSEKNIFGCKFKRNLCNILHESKQN